MTCTQICEQLPLFLYGDLSPDNAQAVEHHLADCASCREAFANLQSVRDALNATPTPEVIVQPSQILLASAERPRQSAWVRRCAGTAVAASLLLLAFLNLEVRIEKKQLMLRWGQPAPVVVAYLPPPPTDNRSLIALEERVRILQELTHALARDVDRRDRDRNNDVIRTQAKLEQIMQTTGQQLGETQRDVDALYAAHFKSPDKGANP
jgi:hypothetical protein